MLDKLFSNPQIRKHGEKESQLKWKESTRNSYIAWWERENQLKSLKCKEKYGNIEDRRHHAGNFLPKPKTF